MASYDDDEDAPLDPAAERLRRKMARLVLVSGGIMALGLIAVFAAIVYKLGMLGPTADAVRPLAGFSSDAPVRTDLALPAGAEILDADLDSDRALLTVRDNAGATSLLLVDLTSGAVLGRYAVTSE